MTDENASRNVWQRWIARFLALCWAGWWIFFGLASGIDEGSSVPVILVHAAIPGALFLISALLPWRYEMLGGKVLLIEGILIAIIYPYLARHFQLFVILMVLLTMALPPLIAGLLCITIARRRSGS